MYIVMNHGFSRVKQYEVLGLFWSPMNTAPGIVKVRNVIEHERDRTP